MFEVLDADQMTSACTKVLALLSDDWIGLANLMYGDRSPPFCGVPRIMTEVLAKLREDGLIEIRKHRGAMEVRKVAHAGASNAETVRAR